MASQPDSRQRMIGTAANLFRSQGYHATGLNQILSAGRAPKGSLYFHFPGGKQQLAVEAVTAAAADMCALLRDTAADAADPRTGMTRVAELFATQLAKSDFRDGCPVAMVALEASGASDAIRTACERAYGDWLSVIEESLCRWGVAVDRAGGLATVALAALEGALLLARVQRDLGPLHTTAEYLADLIAATIPT